MCKIIRKIGGLLMSNKMVFGVLITIIGLVFSTFSFIYATLNPWNWNGIDGLLGSLLGTHMLIPFIRGYNEIWKTNILIDTIPFAGV